MRPAVITIDLPQQRATGVSSANGRHSAYPILPVFLERRSSRAFADEPISDRELVTVLEAARWAPSSFNEQPWRFVVAKRDTDAWPRFFAWLSPSNQEWAYRTAAFVLLVAKETRSERAPHAFDSGAAWAHLALQAAASGLIAHALAGFDHRRAERELNIPPEFSAACLVAIGRPGRGDDLPARLRLRETASQRKALHEIAFDGAWNHPLQAS
jgi:nitroreductase